MIIHALLFVVVFIPTNQKVGGSSPFWRATKKSDFCPAFLFYIYKYRRIIIGVSVIVQISFEVFRSRLIFIKTDDIPRLMFI